MGHDRGAGRCARSLHRCQTAVRLSGVDVEPITMARISTHVLDVARGKPAEGIIVDLHLGLYPKALTQTNADGRTDKPLVSAETLETGGYDLTFRVGDYFRAQ